LFAFTTMECGAVAQARQRWRRLRWILGGGGIATGLGGGYLAQWATKPESEERTPCAWTRMYRVARPVLFQLDPESAHKAALWGLQAYGAMARVPRKILGPPEVDPALEVDVLGIKFSNPIGISAGFDKNAQLVSHYDLLGVGYAEVGSVSAKPADGNPLPRVFRLVEDKAVINRIGLSNHGAEVVAPRIPAIDDQVVPLGVNIAKTHDPEVMGDAAVSDFVTSFRLLAPHARYVTLNISCPNTKEGKTFEDEAAFSQLVKAVMKARSEVFSVDAGVQAPPIFVKVSPLADPSDAAAHEASKKRLSKLIKLARGNGVQGFVATNTAADRAVALQTPSETIEEIGRGGLSGEPLHERSRLTVAHVFRETKGEVPIIGVGGVHDVNSAYGMIRAGASLLQVYSGMVYEGPGLVTDLSTGLADVLRRDGFASVSAAVGVDAK